MPMLSVVELDRLREAARDTWEVIGDDILTAMGRDMTREEVIETVLDADYIMLYNRDLPLPIQRYLKETAYETLREDLRPAFRADLYGF